MHDKLFSAPVAVRLGEGVDLQIASLSDMERFLETWPQHRRGKLYGIAAKACEAAVFGYITMDQARRTLVTFAEATGALREDLEPVVAARAVARGYGGFAA